MGRAFATRRSIARIGVICAAVAALLTVPRSAQAVTGPPLARYPYLTDLTATSVAVTWATTSADHSAGLVSYGPNGNCAQTYAPAASVSSYTAFGEVAPYYTHTAQLPDLSPATSYCYRVYSGAAAPGTALLPEPPDFPMTFTTLPAAGSSSSFSFDVLGDWGETALTNPAKDLYNKYQDALDQQLVNSTTGPNPALFAVSAGDVAYNNGSTTNYGDLNHPADGLVGGVQWSDVFDARYWGKVGSQLPLFPTTGNHGRNSTFFSTWPMPKNISASQGVYGMTPYPAVDGLPAGNNPSDWFAFTAANVRFYVLDVDWSDLSTAAYPDLGLGCGSKACPMYEAERDEHWLQSSQEYQWLSNDLQRDSAQRGASALRMVFFHYPIRVDQNNSTTQSDVYLQNSAANPSGAAASLEALLDQYKVNLAFTAHSHMYQRSIAPVGGVASYVTGGGGGVPTNVSPVCSPTDAYARGWAPTSGRGSSCGTPTSGTAKPTAADQIYHFLKVTVTGADVQVQPTDSTGAVFDPTTYHFGPDASAPTTPGKPTATAVSNTNNVSVRLGSAASDNTGVVAYDVYRDGTYLFSVPPGVSSWTDTAVPGGIHTWTVRARDQRGNQSPDSLPSNQLTFADTVPPSSPGQPTAALSGRQVTLTWGAATDDVAVTGYKVFRDGQPIATDVTGTSYVDNTVTDATNYSYTVRAVDWGSNVGPESLAATVSTPDWTAPTAPTVTVSGAGAGRLAVHWAGAVDNVKVTGYDVYRDGSLAVSGATGTGWTDANLQPGSQHRYRVVATDAAGNRSANSNVVTATAPLITPTVFIGRTPGSVTKGARFAVFGGVLPGVAHTVVLQEYRPASRTWATLRQMTTGLRTLPNGAHRVGYAFTLSRSTKGDYAYRVVWPAGGSYAGVTTRTVHVTVR